VFYPCQLRIRQILAEMNPHADIHNEETTIQEDAKIMVSTTLNEADLPVTTVLFQPVITATREVIYPLSAVHDCESKVSFVAITTALTCLPDFYRKHGTTKIVRMLHSNLHITGNHPECIRFLTSRNHRIKLLLSSRETKPGGS